MFLELNAGYYPVTSYSAPNDAPSPDLQSTWGFGLSVGTYIEFAQTVRIAVGGEFSRLLIEDDTGGEGHINRGAPGGRVDVSVLEMSDTSKLRGTAEALFGGSSITYTPSGGTESSQEDGKNVSLFLGATYAWFENESDSDNLSASLGPHYIKASNDLGGDLSATGLMLKLTISADLFSGGSEGGGGGSSGGGGDGIVAISMSLANESSIIGEFANAARRHGCSVSEKPNELIAKCAEGNIVYIQNGRKCLALCQKGMSESECNALHGSLKGYTPY